MLMLCCPFPSPGESRPQRVMRTAAFGASCSPSGPPDREAARWVYAASTSRCPSLLLAPISLPEMQYLVFGLGQDCVTMCPILRQQPPDRHREHLAVRPRPRTTRCGRRCWVFGGRLGLRLGLPLFAAPSPRLGTQDSMRSRFQRADAAGPQTALGELSPRRLPTPTR
jgi:hypothetical protein